MEALLKKEAAKAAWTDQAEAWCPFISDRSALLSSGHKASSEGPDNGDGEARATTGESTEGICNKLEKSVVIL